MAGGSWSQALVLGRGSKVSYVNKGEIKFVKRRHSVRRVSPEEAIEAANKVVDKANEAIARSISHASAWQAVAAELYQENQAKDQRIEELEKENTRLRKLARPKAGKKKGEWELGE